MDFLRLPARVNQLLYHKDVRRLTPSDRDTAKRWTLQLIRDSHPHWSEAQVEADYERLVMVKVELVDSWSRRFDFTQQ